MSEKEIIQTLATIIFLYGSSILAVIIWSIKHIVRYNLLIKEVKELRELQNKSQQDITAAHNKIRNIQK